MSRRRYGTGSVTKRGDKYIARYYTPEGRKNKTFDTMKKANAFLRKTLALLDENMYSTQGKIPLREWIHMYISTFRTNVAEQTKASYKFSLKRLEQYCPRLMDTKIEDITLVQLQREMNTLREHYHSTTVKRTLLLISSSLRHAVKNRVIFYNHCADVFIQPSEEKHGGKYIPEEDLKKLMEWCSEEDYRNPASKRILLTMAVTACRAEEARALKKIDIVNGGIRIQRALDVHCNEKRVKSDQNRFIPIVNPLVTSMLNKAAKTCQEYLFTTCSGKPVLHRTVMRTMKLVLPKNTPHDLRHTWITNAIRKGVDIKTISELTGDSVNTLLSCYAHTDEKQLIDAMRKMI